MRAFTVPAQRRTGLFQDTLVPTQVKINASSCANRSPPVRSLARERFLTISKAPQRQGLRRNPEQALKRSISEDKHKQIARNQFDGELSKLPTDDETEEVNVSSMQLPTEWLCEAAKLPRDLLYMCSTEQNSIPCVWVADPYGAS